MIFHNLNSLSVSSIKDSMCFFIVFQCFVYYHYEQSGLFSTKNPVIILLQLKYQVRTECDRNINTIYYVQIIIIIYCRRVNDLAL